MTLKFDWIFMEIKYFHVPCQLDCFSRYIDGLHSMVEEQHHLLLLNLEKNKTFQVQPTWKFANTSQGFGSWIARGKNKTFRADCSSEWTLIPGNSSSNNKCFFSFNLTLWQQTDVEKCLSRRLQCLRLIR